MNKQYDIVLLRGDGEDEYLLGRGSLEEGRKLLEKLDVQLIGSCTLTGAAILAHAHDEEYIYDNDEDDWVFWAKND